MTPSQMNRNSNVTLPKQREDSIQEMIVELFSSLCTKYKFMFFMVPNEAAMKARKDGKPIYALIAKLKRMGLTPGAADLVIGWAGRLFFLEVKAADGRQSDMQKWFEVWAHECGAEYEIARDVDEALLQLRAWGIMTD